MRNLFLTAIFRWPRGRFWWQYLFFWVDLFFSEILRMTLPMIERRSDMRVQAFTITIAQSTLDDLHERLARTRWPDEVEGAAWDYGTNLDYLKTLVDYWQHEFDWRGQRAQLTQFGRVSAA